KLNQIQRKQAENTAEIEDAEQELQVIQGQRQELQVAIQTVGAQLADANDRLVKAQADSDRYAVETFLTSISIAKTEKRLEEAKMAQRRSAVLLYQRSDSSAMLDLIGSADGSGDYVEGTHYLHRVSGKRRPDATRVTAIRDELNQ